MGGSHIYKSEVRRGLGPEMEMEVTSVIGGSWGWMQQLQAWLSVETWSPAWWGHLPGNQWARAMLHRGKLSPEVDSRWTQWVASQPPHQQDTLDYANQAVLCVGPECPTQCTRAGTFHSKNMDPQCTGAALEAAACGCELRLQQALWEVQGQPCDLGGDLICPSFRSLLCGGHPNSLSFLHGLKVQ